jgi:hypothetical protein
MCALESVNDSGSKLQDNRGNTGMVKIEEIRELEEQREQTINRTANAGTSRKVTGAKSSKKSAYKLESDAPEDLTNKEQDSMIDLQSEENYTEPKTQGLNSDLD